MCNFFICGLKVTITRIQSGVALNCRRRGGISTKRTWGERPALQSCEPVLLLSAAAIIQKRRKSYCIRKKRTYDFVVEVSQFSFGHLSAALLLLLLFVLIILVKKVHPRQSQYHERFHKRGICQIPRHFSSFSDLLPKAKHAGRPGRDGGTGILFAASFVCSTTESRTHSRIPSRICRRNRYLFTGLLLA